MESINHILKFKPIYKTVIWGGDRIASLKGVEIPLENVGESWELSGVPGHVSVVEDGPFAGTSLNELIARYGAGLLGSRVLADFGTEFPLLIKIIDARQPLSIQVHPDDRLAAERHGSKGKTEMWYVVDATDDARILCGLSKPLDAEGYTRAVEDNTILDYITSHKSCPGQFFYIPAGTIHAIGAGNLIAEIQQTSDITYRVYDYNRRDAQGNTRQLHTAEARDAIDYTFPAHTEPTGEVYPRTTLNAVHSPYFKVDYLRLDTTGSLSFVHTGETFTILVVASGTLEVTDRNGHKTTATAGTTLLVPADMPAFDLGGDATVLRVTI